MDNRTETLSLRLSKEEKNLIIKGAKETCLSVTDYLVLSALSVGVLDSNTLNKRILHDEYHTV